ncbi:MAG: hypothetical protein ACRED4_07855, partial [Brevundimonas sp.]
MKLHSQHARRSLVRILMTSAVAAASLFPVSAMAQSTPQDGEQASALGDVVVTARRRQETLQEIPASVTAISSETIE